jgi:hypothetical protein
LWYKDQVHVFVHQAPGQTRGVIGGARISQQRQISSPIIVTEEHRQTPIAALRYIVRNLWKHDAGEADQEPWLGPVRPSVKYVYSPRNSAVPVTPVPVISKVE